MNALKKYLTNGLIVYFSLVSVYVLFFILVFYFKNKLHDITDAYIISMNLLVMLNVNIMSVVFIKRFNSIKKKIDELNRNLN